MSSIHELTDRVEDGYRELSPEERKRCGHLLEESKILVDAWAANAPEEKKELVMVRMVRRAMGSSDVDIPMGSTGGSISALGYSQSWQMPGGNYGELYLSKVEKKILGISGKIGMVYAFDLEDES